MENNFDFKIISMYENISGKCHISNECDKGDKTGKITLTANPGGYSITRVSGIFPDIIGGKVYEVTVPCRTDNLTAGKSQIIASWLDENGKAYSRGYLEKISELSELSEDVMKICYHVPEKVTALEIEYRLWSHNGGTAVFGMPQITCKGDYKPRMANIAAAWFNTAGGNRTLTDNLADILRIADNAGNSADKPDLLVFSEAIYGRGINLPLPERALKLDSEAIKQICGKAMKYQMYIAVGLHIDDGGLYKNVALIIDRKGDIAHIYNKTHLAMVEYENGLVPGSEIPVYDLDFGRVGVLICWDHFFSEPARILHQKGAEIIILPTAGDTLYQSRSRAVDGGTYIVISGTKEAASSVIIDPHGNVIATAAESPELGYTCAQIDLNQRQLTYWLSVGPCYGEGRDVYLNERRNDLYGGIAEN